MEHFRRYPTGIATNARDKFDTQFAKLIKRNQTFFGTKSGSLVNTIEASFTLKLTRQNEKYQYLVLSLGYGVGYLKTQKL